MPENRPKSKGLGATCLVVSSHSGQFPSQNHSPLSLDTSPAILKIAIEDRNSAGEPKSTNRPKKLLHCNYCRYYKLPVKKFTLRKNLLRHQREFHGFDTV